MINKSLSILEQKGLIIRDTTRYAGGSKRIIKLATLPNSKMAPYQIVKATLPNSKIKEEYIKQNNIKDNNICEFDNFWLIYKRKIDKGRAEKSFNCLTTQEKILAVAGAKKWAEKWDAEKTESEYIPHPTTWLNNKRWETIPPIKKGKSPANAYQDQPDSFLDGFIK